MPSIGSLLFLGYHRPSIAHLLLPPLTLLLSILSLTRCQCHNLDNQIGGYEYRTEVYNCFSSDMAHIRWALPVDLENQSSNSSRHSTDGPDPCCHPSTGRLLWVNPRSSIRCKGEDGLRSVHRGQRHVVPRPSLDWLPVKTNSKSFPAIDPSTRRMTRASGFWLWAKEIIVDAQNRRTAAKSVQTMLLHNWAIFLLPSIPAGFAVKYTNQNPSVVFAVNFIAAIPNSSYLSRAVDEIMAHVGQTVGSLLYVTFRYTPRLALLDIIR